MRNIDHGVCYEQMLARYFDRPMRILEIGAGTGRLSPSRKRRRCQIWAVDPDPRLRENPLIDMPIIDSIERVAFDAESFDLVCSRFVFEHLPDPIGVLNRIYRWLTPNGKVLILTVNRLHYYGWLNQLLPKNWIEALTGQASHDLFPTYYRFNHPFRIPRLVAQSQFGKNAPLRLILCEKYLYSSIGILRGLSRLYSLLVNSCPALRWFRAGLIIEITKPAGMGPV